MFNQLTTEQSTHRATYFLSWVLLVSWRKKIKTHALNEHILIWTEWDEKKTNWALKALKFNIGNTTIEILDPLRLQTAIEIREEEKTHTEKKQVTQ